MTPVDDLTGRACWLGIDLSSVEDLTAVVAIFPDGDGDGRRYDVLAMFLLPEDNIVTKAEKDQADYLRWADQGYPEAFERYMRLALKSQSACRATLDALVKIHQPREQTVRHVHVNDGGQAIVADQFHHRTGERENGKSINQSDATSAAC